MQPKDPMIATTEMRIIGKSMLVDGRMSSDEAERRIDELVSTCLRYVAVDWSGWDKLYQDPTDGRYWELTYPQSHLHGGGSKELRCIDKSDASLKYALTPNP